MQEQRLTDILWRGKWIILASLLGCVALSIFLTSRAEKVYRGTALLRVVATEASQESGDPFSREQVTDRAAEGYAFQITSRSFLEQIRPQVAGGRIRTGNLERRITATHIPDTSLIEIQTEGSSPQDARALASDVVRAFLGVVQQNSQQRAQQRVDALQQKIDALDEQIRELRPLEGSTTGDVRAATLRATQAGLIQQLAQAQAEGSQAATVESAAEPTSYAQPISPRPLVNLLAGILLGTMIGVGLAWLRARLDRGLHSSDEVTQLLDVPVLASIPLRRRFSADDPVLGEAYDVLRANLAFLSLDHPLQVLTLTSYNPGEGKTSTVEGLAYAAVRGGMSVLLIDADVRTRTLSTRLGHAEDPGLTNVIVGMASASDAVIELAGGLAFLPAGPTPPNPPSLLSSGRVVELMAELREQHSLVIIDSPPVASLADASILAAVSDGVVIVSRVGVTRRDQLTAAATSLRHSPTPIVGVVVLEPRTVDDTYYPASSKGLPAVPDSAVTS